jgi:hypothetical protein
MPNYVYGTNASELISIFQGVTIGRRNLGLRGQ